MTSKEIRQSFLDFFASRQHRVVESAPVIPHDDPTLLFTNAGMNQFKDVFLNIGSREYTRATDTQKCIRVSGKHNDLEEVGRDTYHHTFFEMLGNWSFGDYYKKEAISWAWELLTAVWKLPKERLYATVYTDDDEAFELWKSETDIDHGHVLRFGAKDNFWEMGDTGPCGPCSEIHIDMTDDLSGKDLVNAGSPEVIEIWNLVFIQYDRNADGVLNDLPAKHVDTGMGFERICAVLQGKKSNYDTDVFIPVINHIAKLSGKSYADEAYATEMRVIADHVRMLTFAITDGAIPGNEGRGYVLRRILRRAARFGRNLGMREPFLWKVVSAVTDNMGDQFPEIREQQGLVEKVILAEEESFNATLDRGLEIFEGIVAALKDAGKTVIDGKDAFKLYDTFGFPIDLTMLLAEERGYTVDIPGFEKELEAQKERSRTASKGKVEFPTAAAGASAQLFSSDDLKPVVFTGYETMQSEAALVAVTEQDGKTFVVLDKTPFYSESGGQVSDTGALVVGGVEYSVTGLMKTDGAVIHAIDGLHADVFRTAESIQAVVGEKRRWDTMRNHTVTHVLHAALRTVLGTHVQQAGSMVGPERMRFDFSHFQKVTNEELTAIERIVNEKILERIEVTHHRNIPFDEAKKMGALMFFGDKYGDFVNVIQIGTYSLEFCGGTHVWNTSQIGLFKITSESSIASGTRRIEAVTGRGVEQYIHTLQETIHEKDSAAEMLHDKIKSLEKELARRALEGSGSQLDTLIEKGEDWNGAKIIVSKVEVPDADGLKSLGDMLREKMTSGAGILASVIDGKVSLVCVVTDDLIKERGLKAGAIIGKVAKMLGGGGGGRPHLATAGAKDAEKLDSVLQQSPDIIKEAGA